MGRWKWHNVPVPEGHITALAAGLALDRLWPAPVTRRRSTAAAMGGLLAATGALLAAWAVLTSGEVDLESPAALVTGGPYRLTRNPMYLAWSVASVGIGLVANSAWVVALVPAGVLASHADVLREERDLAARFGEEYARYAATAPRYL